MKATLLAAAGFLACCWFASIHLLSASPAEAEHWTRTRFREVDTLFANPGQGWMSQQRSPRAEPRFPCSVVYIRFNWADAEPHAITESFAIPAELEPGAFVLAIALVDATGQGEPFRLAIDAPETQGRYQVGTLRIL